MWIGIISALVIVMLTALVFISRKAARFGAIRKISGGTPIFARLVSFVITVAVFVVLCLILNVVNAVICFVNLFVIWMLCDLVFLIVRLIRKKGFERYYAGYAAIAFTVIYLAVGWYFAHHVYRTPYSFETEKDVEKVKIVQITDSHIGATFDAEKFSSHIDRINSEGADVVFVTGDFVDDNTSAEDMRAGCRALGRLETKYGVYFVFGNHDVGYYNAEKRGWSISDLTRGLEENGVVVLEDESVLIDGRFYVVGRKDRSFAGHGDERMSAKELTDGLDRSKYIIMLDHQPYDFDAEAEAGADLVLCGHTHGGQLIPVNHVGEWIGENDLRYGHERRQDTDFIVSSGIGCWSLKFKTGCISEYCVIDIEEK